MSNKLFQGVIHQMRDAVGRTIGVIDDTGTIISCSELGKIGETVPAAVEVFSRNDSFYSQGYTYKTFGNTFTLYAVFIDGKDELTNRYVEISCVVWPTSNSFMTKSTTGAISLKMSLDNILPGDIYLSP